ncbi:hypothetical protein [Marinimicrobium locisalis]|uniref:hypothetical protein n=1 Tax=Marinimicrobium locisalis TaxID=546022 RepID=UPI003221A25B
MYKPDFRPLPLKTLAALLLGLTLTACGGGDGGSRLDNINDGNIGGENGGGGDDGPAGENEPAQLGHGSAEDFVAGEIEVGIGDAALAPGGSTTLTVTMVNGAGELVTSAVDVSFNSDCIASGRSVLTQAGEEIESTVTTNNGRAEVTYTSNGCTGVDDIVARATYEGLSAGSARASIEVLGDAVQTIEFLSAEPSLISLKGTGGRETSKVTFRVVGSTGSPMRDVDVAFQLRPGGTGGLALVNSEDTSNSNGEVTTTVQAGTVATSVSVTATTTTDNGDISTQSSELVVSTGIPDQNSMSIAADNLYPVSWKAGGGFYLGTESNITVRLADAFNNTAPDGTTVTFTTSGGAIQSSCTMSDGTCSVRWNSQHPFPEAIGDFILDEGALTVTCPSDENCRDGRVKVLATAIGNESFVDRNNNGRYEAGTDVFLSESPTGECERNRPKSYADNPSTGCDDLGTAYLDKNFNGVYDPEQSAGEEIVTTGADEGSDGSTYQPGDGIYNGILCSDASLASGDCTKDPVTIRDEVTLIMTCDTPYVMGDSGLPGQPDGVNVSPGGAISFDMLLIDCNGNGMAPGTVVEVNTDNLEDGDANVFPDGELAGSPTGHTITVTIKGTSDDKLPTGSVRLSVISPIPGGEKTTYLGKSISVN